MLRITNVQCDGESSLLRLEGKLLEPLLDDLQLACRSTAVAANALTLDLAGLTFIDTAGTVALRELRCRGIKLTGCSPLVTELLKETNK